MKTFIEIGAADFDSMFNAKNWRGIICEPHPYFYNKLTQSSQNPNITILDVAVGSKSGVAEMYVPTKEYIEAVENNEEQNWARGVGSVIPHPTGAQPKLKNAIQTYNLNEEEVAQTISVKMTTLDAIVSTFGYDTIDFLKIDAEGYDVVIIENYSWKVKPTFIKCEHGQPKNPAERTQKMLKILKDQGYKCWLEEWDIYAIWM